MKALKSAQGDTLVIYEYPQDPIKPHKRVMSQSGYLSIFGTFDIETTNIELNNAPLAIMYIWQACIGDLEGKQRDIYVGRTWRDFIDFLVEIADYYHLHDKRRIVWYVHNLGFEFQFLRSLLYITDMFAVEKRVPVSFIGNGCHEFRCSWRLTNMSLAKFCESENVPHGKLSGYDYLKKRYPDTPLKPSELLYCVDDVLGLHEGICHSLKMSGDTLATVPKTSTGYVRREARERMKSNVENYYAFRDNALSPFDYKLCKAATRGGNTHANVLYSGQILGRDEDGAPAFVHSRDKKSSYPFEMCLPHYPVGKFLYDGSRYGVRLPDVADGKDCVIMHVVLYNVRLKPNIYFPYIAKNKCQKMPPKANRDYWYDNGRVLKAPYIRCVINEIDAAIIESQYDYEKADIVDAIRTSKGYLSKEYRDYVLELFRMKCELEFGDPYFYAKFKNKINALFGMMLTDITREDIRYALNQWTNELPPVATALIKYYQNFNSFLSYQHGLYVTSNARLSLERGLRLVGIDGVYTDTDSVKYIGDYTDKFNALNSEIIAYSKSCGIEPVTVQGKTSILGIWEEDAAYSGFITHGAKKYAYRYSYDDCNKPNKRGHLGVTVAGLNKSKAVKYLEEKGGLKAFDAGKYSADGYTHGLEFGEFDSGRLEAKYDDLVRYERTTYKGHKIEVTSNVALLPTTYTLGITKEYSDLIEMKESVFL